MCAKPKSPVIAGDLEALLQPTEGPLEALVEPEITGDGWLLVLFCCMFVFCAQPKSPVIADDLVALFEPSE